MALTPNIMMAVEGLLADDALDVAEINTDLYLSQVIVKDYLNTITIYEKASVGTDPPVSLNLLNEFIYAIVDIAPYISNTIPESDELSTEFYTTLLDQHIKNLFPSNQQFAQYALISIGHIATANQFVNSAVSGQKLAAQTFTSSDALMSGNITSINSNIREWGQELISSGLLFDFAKLDNIGTPQSMIESLIDAQTLRSISEELESQGVNAAELQRSISNNPDAILPAVIQKQCYDAFLLVTGAKLSSILDSLKFATAGIATLADLLDLIKIFPKTYTTITTPNNGPLEKIYTGSSISTFVRALTPVATAYMPDDIAKANYAFVISLAQIKGILNSDSEKIGTAASNIENNSGLAKTGGLDTALPAKTSASIIADMGGGTGPNSTFYLSDLIGAPAAEPHNTNIAIMVKHFQAIQKKGGFAKIAEILEIMRGVLNGDYTVISVDDDITIELPKPYVKNDPIPANGIYTSKDAALTALIAELQIATTAYTKAYPTEHAAMLKAFNGNFDSIIISIQQLWSIDVKFKLTYLTGYETGDPKQDGLAPNKKTTLAFAESLPNFGKKTDKGNIAIILEALAADTLGGNAIVAAMREGRNAEKLAAAGVKGDNQLSDKPSVVEPGNIS